MNTTDHRYYLAAVFEANPDHPRWKTEPMTEEECSYTYKARPYKSYATALRALQGHWGEMVAIDADMESQSDEKLQGYYLGDVVIVEEVGA